MKFLNDDAYLESDISMFYVNFNYLRRNHWL